MASDNLDIGDFYLLQPELLNKTALKQILELRCVKLQNLELLSKEQLVEIFYRVAVPLPQRKYRENRRGKLLTKLRRKQERNIQKAEPTDKKSAITYGFKETSTSRTHVTHSTGDRLKPPPDAINFERKKIKLNSSTLSSDDLECIRIKRLKKFDKPECNGDVLDRIIIKDRRKEKEEKSQVKSTVQKLDSDSSTNKLVDKSSLHGSDLQNTEKNSSSKKIKLKRSYSSTISEIKDSSTTSTSKDTEVKKNKTRIMWP